ncbi:hypothetical protein L195_g049913 [Trifolium pratense]|uniref:Uncharacterized protein n=1 Tax=Trifolium pratense TaxID=57577 RepID=A0A2K3JR72_TRIPR|nr:hypothetical protein L195_g049913 [Trifolium pratense]
MAPLISKAVEVKISPLPRPTTTAHHEEGNCRYLHDHTTEKRVVENVATVLGEEGTQNHNHHESLNDATLQEVVQEIRRLRAHMAAIEAVKAEEREKAKKAAKHEEDEGIVES